MARTLVQRTRLWCRGCVLWGEVRGRGIGMGRTGGGAAVRDGRTAARARAMARKRAPSREWPDFGSAHKGEIENRKLHRSVPKPCKKQGTQRRSSSSVVPLSTSHSRSDLGSTHRIHSVISFAPTQIATLGYQLDHEHTTHSITSKVDLPCSRESSPVQLRNYR